MVAIRRLPSRTRNGMDGVGNPNVCRLAAPQASPRDDRTLNRVCDRNRKRRLLGDGLQIGSNDAVIDETCAGCDGADTRQGRVVWVLVVVGEGGEGGAGDEWTATEENFGSGKGETAADEEKFGGDAMSDSKKFSRRRLDEGAATVAMAIHNFCFDTMLKRRVK